MAMFYFVGTIVLYALIAFLVLFGLGGLTKAIIDDHREKRAREDKREADWRHTYDFWQKRCFGFQAEADELRKAYQEAMEAKWQLAAEVMELKSNLEWAHEALGRYQEESMKIQHAKWASEVEEEEDCYPEERVIDRTRWQGYLKPQEERAQPNMIPASVPFLPDEEGYDNGWAMLPSSYRD